MFAQNIDSIVANWLGMHAYIISQSPIEIVASDRVFEKTVIGFNQSAAEEITGSEPWPNEIHYFYVSENNSFMDIDLRDESYTEDIEKIIKNIVIK